MANQEAVSSVLAKISGRIQASFEKHKNDATEFGQVELPAGIRAGIAEVTSVTMGVFREGTKLAGEAYWMASAIVKEPKKFKTPDGRTHKTFGGRTSIGPEPLCDTPDRQSRQTLDEHMAWILNEMRKMGLNTATLPKVINLEALCKAMVNPKKPIYIHFDTFGGPTDEDPNGRVNHKWLGPADPSEITPTEGGVEEGNHGALPTPQKNGAATANGSTPGSGVATAQRTGNKPGTRTAASKPAPEPDPEPEEGDFTDAGDIFSLAEAADGGDNKAADQLADQASAMGFSEEQVNTAPTWRVLADAMNSGTDPADVVWEDQDGGAGDEDGSEGEKVPEVGDIYQYKPIDQKTKKPAKTPIEVEVLSVNAGKQTVTLKNINNPKIKYADVAWDALEQDS